MKKILFAAAVALTVAAPALADDPPQDIWKAKCKSCHGEDGAGKTKEGAKEKIKDMSAPEWQTKVSDADIKDVITNGSKDNKKMKAFKEKLSESEIDSLVKYIRTLKKG